MVVMDEFHFYAEPQRGWAWQVPLLTLPQAQFLLMSATLGDVRALREDLTRRTGRETALVDDAERPVPLHFECSVEPLHELLEDLVQLRARADLRRPLHPGAALERAQSLLSARFCTREERDEIAEAIGGFRFSAGFGKTLSRLVRARHRRPPRRDAAALPPAGGAARAERAAQGDLRDRHARRRHQRAHPHRRLHRAGEVRRHRQRLLKAREFHQIAGRAGRAGFDTAGYVVVQAPEHAIENARRLAKAGDDAKKRKRVQKVSRRRARWAGPRRRSSGCATPCPRRSSRACGSTTAIILNLINQRGDPDELMRALLEDNHEDERGRLRLTEQARSLTEELLGAGVLLRLTAPDEHGRTLALAPELQDDFALNQPLARFALDAISQLDPDSETYALDVLSVIEAVLDDPFPILMAQARRNARRRSPR